MELKDKLLAEQTRGKIKASWVLVGLGALLMVGGLVGLMGYTLDFLSWQALLGAGFLGAAKGGYDLRAAQKTLDSLE